MMRRNSLKVFVLAVFSAGFDPAAAHNGDRVFPISYLSEETLALLDQDDGVVEDWLDAVGEPTLTPLDFGLWTGMRRTSTFDRHDPSSLDFRIWMDPGRQNPRRRAVRGRCVRERIRSSYG